MPHTLVLNGDGAPLTVVPLSALHWHDAIKLMYIDRVNILEEYDDWEVRSPSMTLKVPSVLMLRDFVGVVRVIKFSRYNVFLRDLFTCQYCDTTLAPHMLTLDHVNPRYRGGQTKWDNVVASCADCNHVKAHHTDGTPPKNWPRQPDYYEMVEKRKKFPIAIPHPTWIPYMGWDERLIVKKW